mgnify:CR=1 FL=1
MRKSPRNSIVLLAIVTATIASRLPAQDSVGRITGRILDEYEKYRTVLTR